MITRNRLTRNFSTVPNAAIIDLSISSGALRVLLLLISMPDGWEVSNSYIQKTLNIKQAQTLANYWKELQKSGWMTRFKEKDTKGQFIGGYDYQLNEYPIRPERGENHNMDKPQYGKTLIRENPQYINNTKEQEHNKTIRASKTKITTNVVTKDNANADALVSYFNEKTQKSKYLVGSDRAKVIQYINAMLKAGDSVEDIKILIDHKINNPNTKNVDLTSWLNAKYAGDNMAKAKDWHNAGRPVIPLYLPEQRYTKPQTAVESLKRSNSNNYSGVF